MINIDNINRYLEWKGRWANPEPMDLIAYVSFNIHPEDFLIVSNIFFPETIEVDDCIFLSENFDMKIYKNVLENYSAQRMDIEKTINRIRLYDLFAHCPDRLEDSVFESVGKLLQFSWSLYFKNKYPHFLCH